MGRGVSMISDAPRPVSAGARRFVLPGARLAIAGFLFAVLAIVSLGSAALARPQAGRAQPSSEGDGARDRPAEPPASGPLEPRLTRLFGGTQHVHVIDVEVRLTGTDGKPVTGLKAEDFELLEDGRPVRISNFFAVEGGRQAALEATSPSRGSSGGGEPTAATSKGSADETPDLYLAVFVDNVQIRAANRNRLLQRLEDRLSRDWRPGMSVMVATNDRGLQIRRPFTGRRDEVLAGLAELREDTVRGSRLERDLESLLAGIQRVNVDAGSGLVGTKAGMWGPGRLGNPTTLPEGELFDIESQGSLTAQVASEAKALIPQILGYAQQRNDETVGSLQVLSKLIETMSGLPGRKAILHVSDGLSVNSAEAVFEAFDRHFEPLSRVPGVVGLSRETGRYDLQDRFSALAGLANAGRVSLYPLDASPPEVVRRGGAEQGSTFRGPGFASTEERNEQEPLRFLAEQTGGRSSLSNVSLESVVASALGDFECYYSLGFVAEPEPGRSRRLEVRLKDPDRGLRVRHRSTVRDRTGEERMAEQTLAALLLGSLHNPLGVRLEALDAEPAEDGNYRVPVMVRIPLSRLVLVPGAREHRARVSMSLAVADGRGRVSEVMHQLCPIQVPNSELLVALGRNAGCGARLLMRPGEQRVAVAVRDELSDRESTVQLRLDVGGEGQEAAGEERHGLAEDARDEDGSADGFRSLR